MKLQTTIPLKPELEQIDYESDVLMLGSCFTEHIGRKLEFYKFQNVVNPFGIIFHPKAIERLITRAVANKMFTSADIFQQDEKWHCLEVHSLIAASEENEYLEKLNELLRKMRDAISKSSHVIITYGTCWGYRHKDRNEIVANCHKIPQKQFTKELSSIAELVEITEAVVKAIRSLNEDTKIIFTVSPVRHLKDGFVENSRSKAQLISAIHSTIDGDNKLKYFPSYEIMMDDLRDYRFYAEDLLHPNSTAVEIIWKRFSEVWIDSGTRELQQQIASIQNGLMHRPFNPESESYKVFQADLQKKISIVKQQLPHLSF